MRRVGLSLSLTSLLAISAAASECHAAMTRPSVLPTVSHVDLRQFMGDWYVQGNIPTAIEKQAWNAKENYRLREDGTIDTTFTFNKGRFDGPRKQYHPHGFVRDSQTNATWGMQFVWPIKAEYLIAYVSDDYMQTIIARSKRDYVWIMTRAPQISDQDYVALTARVKALGYDVSKLRRVPQQSAPRS